MKKKLFKKTITLFLYLLLFHSVMSSYGQSNPTCLGEAKELVVAAHQPYTKVKIGNIEGYFVLDFATTQSRIDANSFINGKPQPKSGTDSLYENFDFYGSWGTVKLLPQDFSNLKDLGTIKQAGIIGVDFLCLNTFALDFQNKILYRNNENSFCSDSILFSEGYMPVSTEGYFSNVPNKLKDSFKVNIPTVPIKIGGVAAIGQIDPAFDDAIYHHSININQAFYDLLIHSGVTLNEVPGSQYNLPTCKSGVMDRVTTYKLTNNAKFEIIGIDNLPIVSTSDVYLVLKTTAASAMSCGGISAWQRPAAQIAASFLNDAKKIIFDPYKSKVWFYTK